MRKFSFYLLISAACAPLAWGDEPGGASVDFARDIRPILSDKCFSCHGPDEEHRKGGLRLDQREAAFAERDGVAAFQAGDAGRSEAWRRIVSGDPEDRMPPPKAKKPLGENEKALLLAWIEGGAEWSEHWSFAAPEKAEPPGAESSGGVVGKNPIDRFLEAALAERGLSPAPPADRRTLIRRLSFDLTGLPPAPEEIRAFLKDDSATAVETLVDRLLDSPHFGERMALMWLDAARYGDTSVMHADGPRDMWPWRDWVVEAFNRNQPYDRFSIEQIAGDLLPEPTNAQLVASGFNRNHPSSDEGGAIPEELRVSYVVDRVKTTANVWLGLSMECAQCHDHKYDPISQREYFQFYAYFNNTVDPGMQSRRGNQEPVVEVVSEVEEEALARLDEQLGKAGGRVASARESVLAEALPSGEGKAAPDREARLKHLKHHFALDDVEGRVLLDARGGRDALGEKELVPATEASFGRGIRLDAQRTFDALEFTEFEHNSKLTFSAWVKIDAPNTGGAVFAKMDSARNHRGFDFWFQGGKPGIHLVNQWPSNALKVVSETALEPGEWHHVAISYDGSGHPEGVKIYVDGEEGGATVEAKRLTGTIKNEVPFRIGGRSAAVGFKGEVDDIRFYDRVLAPEEIAWTREDLVAEAEGTLAAERSPAQRTLLQTLLLSRSSEYSALRAAELDLERERVELLRGKATSMVMRDNPPEKLRPTYLLERGEYDAPREDEVISPGTPAVLPPLPADAPANRLALAQWLFAEDHPLTARVAANQVWQIFFSHGIVRTPGDFGAQGEFPTHPELLDWLAVDFRESGWDLKRLVRQIVLSEAYRRSSHLRPGDLESDPENRLLARAPRNRLPAEMIRDNALALSGQLVLKIGGPGVKPYQPPGLWAEVGLGGNPKFVQDTGEKLYRRSLYTYWKRSAPPPAMALFDAPNRETCVLQRPVTNTPLQALAAMNDVQMMEAARHLAERILREGGSHPAERAAWLFELATARAPEAGETAALLDVYESGLSAFTGDAGRSAALLGTGDSGRDETLPLAEHAAWTVVSSLVLNLDEVFTRN